MRKTRTLKDLVRLIEPEKGPPLFRAGVVVPSSIEAAFLSLQKGPAIILGLSCETSNDLLKKSATSDSGASLVPAAIAGTSTEKYT